MKCDELTPIDLECNMGKDINGVEHREPWKAYDIEEVNAAIAELKEALQESENARYEAGADAADYYQENSRLKRALWLARANRALDKIAWFKLWNSSISTMNPEDGARQEFDKWKKNLGKFLKKAKEYR